MEYQRWQMNIRQGIHHKRTVEDILISVLQGAIVTIILVIVALVAVDAFIKEDDARIAKLRQHFYDVAYSRSTVGPAAPTGLKTNYGALAEPKTRVFADTSVKAKAVK
jgi:hypothetical protein